VPLELAALADGQGFVGVPPTASVLRMSPEMPLWLLLVVLAFGDARDPYAAASRDVPIQEEDHP
jgi:hypothetical protein